MSMSNYSVDAYGVYLNDLVDVDRRDELAELADTDDIGSVFSFTGEVIETDDGGCPIWSRAESFCDDTVYYIEVSRYPRFFKAAYRDIDDLVSDLKKNYDAARKASSGLLPKLTKKQVREHFRYIGGVYYG